MDRRPGHRQRVVEEAGLLGGEQVRHVPLLDLVLVIRVLPEKPEHVLFDQPGPVVGDQRLADDGRAPGEVVADDPAEALPLGEQRHRPAAQEGVDEGQLPPGGPGEDLVDLPEDDGAELALAAEVAGQGPERTPHRSGLRPGGRRCAGC